jgi:lycopene cyclase domain-containing protein
MESGTYMGLILAWAAPVVALQWLFMGPAIWRLRKAVFPAILVPTLYLWVADWYAISQGIWYISERFTFGVNPFGLPVEEATFFLITNVLVVFGSVLFLAPGLPHLVAEGPDEVLRERTPRGVLTGGLALTVGMLACDGTPQGGREPGGDEPPVEERGLTAQARDRLVVPGERVGMLTSQTSEEALRVMVDPRFIQRAEIPVGKASAIRERSSSPTPRTGWR